MVWKFNKGAFYRTSRMLHAYLSAAAFLMLIFFAASGILLNHPDWFGADRKSHPIVLIELTETELAAILDAPDPVDPLVSRLRQDATLIGQLKGADFTEYEAVLQFAGVKGQTDVFLDYETRIAEVEAQSANLVSVIHGLHRGKDAGGYWKALIDITAGTILVMSLIGLILFFSLRFRLATSLKIMVATLGVIAGVFVFLTP
ncbi:MAG: PepSY-associated TM helix domain-containing protein [Pseudomonadota bacterium]